MKNTFALPTFALTLAFVGSSFLSAFTGFRPDQLPFPQIDPPVQPAGWAFSVWLVIYAWLIASALFGLWRRAADAGWNRVRLPLMGSLAIGTPWLAVAGVNAIAATVMIILMAALAIAALLRAPAADRLWLQVPVALYAGWLTAASFVALASTSAGYGLVTDSLGWAYLGLAGALTVALAVLARRPQAPEYALTVIWALIGIVAANLAAPTWVATAAGAGAVALAVMAIIGMLRTRAIT